MRTRVQNALHALALGHGVRRGHTLWNREGQALASLPLAPHTAHRRSELQALYQHLDAQVDRLDERVKMVATERHRATLLMTHPGVGRVTELAMLLRPMNLDDLRWYFHARQAPSRSSDERFDQAARAFRAPRFRALYHAWLERGKPVLDATLSVILADKIERQVGQLECHVLPHHYLDLSPLVGTA
jgi:hypothetical protein